MIIISKYYIVNIEIAQFIVAMEILFAIFDLVFLLRSHTWISKRKHLFQYQINQFSYNSGENCVNLYLYLHLISGNVLDTDKYANAIQQLKPPYFSKEIFKEF